MAFTESPRDLLQSLAECIHIDRHNLTRRTTASSEIPRFNQELKRSARRLAYEHLLFGRPRRTDADSGFDDPLKELGFVQFEMAFADRERADQLAKCIRQMIPEGPGDMELGYEEQRVLTFLLNLRNVKQREETESSKGFPKPSILGSLMNINNSDYFLKRNKNAPRMPFFELDTIKGTNPYTNKLMFIQTQYKIHTLKAPKKPPPEPCVPQPPPPSNRQFQIKCASWDHLDQPLASRLPSRPFFSQSPSAMLHIICKNQVDDSFQPRLLTTSQLLADIKLLLVGIRSETFLLDEDTISFSILPAVSLDDGTPTVTAGAMSEFIECGTCCARLRQMCNKNVDFSHKFDGFIFMALCSSVEEYLGFYEKFVRVTEDRTVSGLSNRMKTMMLQISQLSKMLAIHPDGEYNAVSV